MTSFEPPVIGLQQVQDNAMAVCRYHLGTRGVVATALEVESLRRSFLAALDGFQRYSMPPGAEQGLVLELEHVTSEATAAVGHLMALDELPANFRYAPAEHDELRGKARAGLELLAELDPDMIAGFHTIVGALLFARSRKAGAGGVSDFIGAIWFGPGPDWDAVHYAEYLLHEYVHQCLFLDDMVRRIFAEELGVLSREESKVMSTVTRVPRDYDKAFHSAFVGYSIMQLYDRLGATAKVQALTPALSETLRGLAARPQLLTSHGRELLADLIERACSRYV